MSDSLDHRFETSLEGRVAAAEAWIMGGRETQRRFEDTVLDDLKDIKQTISDLSVAVAQTQAQGATSRRFGDRVYSTLISVAVVVIGFVLSHFASGMNGAK
jgi:hypothetical protein